MWLLQVLRASDNFQTSFTCNGTMTITQVTGSYSFSGFMVSTGPCEPVTLDVTGSFQPNGAVTFTAHAPRPPQGPCPSVRDVSFSGIITNANRLLSARGVARVQCPQLGEHTFTYVVTATRQ
jgi:hypothetical protein